MASAEDTICSGPGQPVFLQVQMPEGAAVLKVNQIKLPLNHSKKQLKEAIVHKLRIRPEEMIDYRILKQSIDARKSGKGGHAGEVLYQYSVAVTLANEKQYLKKHHANKRYTALYTGHLSDAGKGNGQTSKASGNHRQRTGRPVLWAHAGQTGI